MPEPYIDHGFYLASETCINCDEEIYNQSYISWDERNVTICSDCLLKLHDQLFTVNTNISNENRTMKLQILNSIRWEIWERDNFTCQYCGFRKYLSIDHIHPESRGGTMTLDNLVTSCRSCNSKKAARTPEEARMLLMNDPRM